MNRPTGFDDLTERQQAACFAFARKYGVDREDIALRLDIFFKLAHGEITILQAEEATGLVIIDHTHPTLF
ncbi:MAG: hypothetical protein JO250_09250 [Armatimonadetes bacterium]|nr:hypothetical protein [Armatimonadota bacterium]